jgi:hypothetical protein
VEDIQVCLKSDVKSDTVYEEQYICIISFLFRLRMRNVSDKNHGENHNIHFTFSNFFSKIVPFMRYVEKYIRAGEFTDDNMAHAHCMLYT